MYMQIRVSDARGIDDGWAIIFMRPLGYAMGFIISCMHAKVVLSAPQIKMSSALDSWEMGVKKPSVKVLRVLSVKVLLAFQGEPEMHNFKREEDLFFSFFLLLGMHIYIYIHTG